MSVYQAAFLGLFLLALLGRPDWRLAVIWIVSFAACMAHTFDEMALAAISVTTAAAFSIIETRRAQVIAGLYALMAFSYVGGTVWDWPESTTYGIVELLGVAALGAIGGIDGLLRRLASRIGGRRGSFRLDHRRGVVARRDGALSREEKVK